MFERFTKRARDVVTEAVRHSQDSGADEVRPEHLMMALLDDPQCLAVRVLEELGAPAADVRELLGGLRGQYVDGLDEDDADALKAVGIDLEEVVRRIDENLGGLSPRRRGHRPFSRASKKTLSLALREALALKHNYIGTEHILLGLARGDDRVVSDTFAHFGLERAALRTAVGDAVRRAQ